MLLFRPLAWLTLSRRTLPSGRSIPTGFRCAVYRPVTSNNDKIPMTLDDTVTVFARPPFLCRCCYFFCRYCLCSLRERMVRTIRTDRNTLTGCHIQVSRCGGLKRGAATVSNWVFAALLSSAVRYHSDSGEIFSREEHFLPIYETFVTWMPKKFVAFIDLRLRAPMTKTRTASVLTVSVVWLVYATVL